jgi:hypothetical protein
MTTECLGLWNKQREFNLLVDQGLQEVAVSYAQILELVLQQRNALEELRAQHEVLQQQMTDLQQVIELGGR